MFKSITLAIACLTVTPVIQPSQAVANSPNLILSDANTAQTPESVERSPELIERERSQAPAEQKRSPESIERQRSPYEKQLEWRRKYGDLAPSRQQK